VPSKWAGRTSEVLEAGGRVHLINRRCARLIDVEKPPQMMPLRPHVGQLHHHFGSQLLLDVQVVIFHVGSLDIPVKRKGVALQAGAAWRVVNRNSVRDWREGPSEGGSRNDLILAGSNRVIGWSRIEEGRIWQVTHDHILRK